MSIAILVVVLIFLCISLGKEDMQFTTFFIITFEVGRGTFEYSLVAYKIWQRSCKRLYIKNIYNFFLTLYNNYNRSGTRGNQN